MIARWVRILLLAGLLGPGAMHPPTLFAQSAATHQASSNAANQASSGKESDFAEAENRWMLTPVDIQRRQDLIEPSIRAARSWYWESLFQRDRDEAAEAASHGVLRMGAVGNFSPAFIPEIPSTPDASWIIAKFTGYQVIAIDPKYQDFYTEENFEVVQVIRQPAQGGIVAGSQFQVDFPEGTILTPQRQVISHTTPARFFEQPGHTYFLQIVPTPGDFFNLYKRWDIGDGRLRADNMTEAARARGGKAKLSGMTIADAVKYVQDALSKN